MGFVWLNTKTLLLSLNLWEIHGFGFFPNGIELALAPLFYFYVVSLVQSEFTFAKKDWLHFMPFLLSQSYAIVVYIATMQTPLLPEKELTASSFHFNEIKGFEEYLTILSTLVYLYFGYRHIRNYKYWLSNNTSDTQFSELNFLNNLVFGFLFFSIYMIVNLILNQFLDQPYQWRWQLSHLMIATLVYYMGLVGYKNSDLIPQDFSIKLHGKTKKSNVMVDLDIIAKLSIAIETDKVYLDPKLSLQELAKILNVNETILSNTINTHYKKNFRSLINELRVKEVETRLLNDGMGNLSLLGLAKDCGFNSEASFYRIFKATTGSTPKQFLETSSSGSHF
ncbi:MAG: AraC family transcriptional regulator [Oleispira sp.]|nr:AraC family transcriptional regulator [Oleispira sp.]